jgi:cysteine desulfurase/selenocysteine lyase
MPPASTVPEANLANELDSAALMRLANEFFKTFPAESAPAAPVGAGPLPGPLNVPQQTSIPAEADLPGFPSPLTAQAPPSGPADAPVDIGTGHSFSFLDEIRPRFPEPEAAPSGPNPFFEPIGEVDLGFADIASSTQPPASTSPGGPGFADSPPVPAFSFLEDARPLYAFPPVEAIPSQGESDKDLGFADIAAATQPPMPTLPSVPGFADSPAVPEFSFLQDARPLYAFPPAVPGPAPAPFVEAMPSQAESPDRSIPLSSSSFSAEAVRRDFPILKERVNGRPLVWLDNAATTQKPQSVIDRLSYFYTHENSNVHRAAHELAARATDAYESARDKVRRFLNASTPREIVFVRGATEGINLIAQSWGRRNVRKDDEIVITWLEHHANIVPWQMLCSETGARLRVAPVDDSGQVILEEYEKLLGPRTRLVSFSQVSNALGTITPLTEITEAAHRHGALVLVDGAQSISHMRVDVQALDCDFFVLSGHKMFAPTGIGVVFGKSSVLDSMPPWQGGGNMIQDVTFEKTTYQPPPGRFEAGTGNIADAVGLGAAIDYLDRVGMPNVSRHEHELLVYATNALQRVPGLRIIGTAREKAAVLSFVINGFRTEDIGQYLNREGIAVRAGHHCAQPILRRFGVESTVRASLALYNTCEDIDALTAALFRLAGETKRY